MSRRTSTQRNSARGKPTDLQSKQGRQRPLEPDHSQTQPPIKAGRNMGGRTLTGARQRRAPGRAGA